MTNPSDSLSDSRVGQFYEEFHAKRKKSGTVDIPERLEFIRQEVGTGHDVIELGCRYGDIISLFHAQNRVIGVDVDRGALQKCRERFGVETHVVNLNETLPFADGSFDRVVLTEVLEHLPYPDITLTEVRRILRPGGKLVGSVPNGAHLRCRLRFLFTATIELDPTHLHHFSPRTLKRLLETYFQESRVIPVSGKWMRLSRILLSKYLLFSSICPKK